MIPRLGRSPGGGHCDLEWISNKVLLYSTGNCIQDPVINHYGKVYEKKSVCVCVCVCIISLVQSLSLVQLFVTPWTVACQASLPITSSRSLLRLMSIKSVMPSNHLILCHPLLLLLSIFPSIRSFPVSQFFASGSQRIGAPASASVLPMNIQD